MLLVKWRAMDLEGLSEWQPRRATAVEDAVAWFGVGEEDVTVTWQFASRPFRAKRTTAQVRRRALARERVRRRAVPRPALLRGCDETARPSESRRGRGRLRVLD